MSKPSKTQVVRYVYSDVVSLVRNYGPQRGAVLEIGCGTGNNLTFFAENGYVTHGIDLDKNAVAFAKKFVRSKKMKADIRVADATHLPYPDASLDLVLDRACLQHNSPVIIEKIIDEVYRVLKRNGIFMIVNFRSKKDTASQNIRRQPSFKHYDFVHFTDRKELRSFLKRFSIKYLEERVSHELLPKRYDGCTFFVVAKKIVI